MKTVLLSYASTSYRPWQQLNAYTGLRSGFDVAHSLGPGDIDPDFSRKHADTLASRRGAGYWLWKPYITTRILSQLADGDYLFYCDAACFFVRPIQPMLDLMEREGLELLVLDQGYRESEFTKRDAFVLMDCDRPRYAGSPQRFASYFMLRKGAWSTLFADSFLRYARDHRILTDRPNTQGLPNYPDFRDHRHDQSIFSLLTKVHGVEVSPVKFFAQGLPDPGSQVINHTRLQVPPGRIVHYLLRHRLIDRGQMREIRALFANSG